jgi:predicted Fe-Mo cluster-binding NifX family protein
LPDRKDGEPPIESVKIAQNSECMTSPRIAQKMKNYSYDITAMKNIGKKFDFKSK